MFSHDGRTMDPDRISIARILALGLPFTWQEAVAVCRAAAMVNDVDAAMNDRPPLVNADACFITSDGQVELPETADHESPEAVVHLLREMLEGREAPERLRALASSRGSQNLSAALAEFPLSNARGQIGALATRALGHARVVQDPVTASPIPAATPPVRLAAAPRPNALAVIPPANTDQRRQVAMPSPPRAEVTALGTAEELQRLRRRSAASPAVRAAFADRLRQMATSLRRAATLTAALALVAVASVALWLARAAPAMLVEARHISSGSGRSIVIPGFSVPVTQHVPDRRAVAVSQVIAPAHASGAATATPLVVPENGGVTLPLAALSADLGTSTAADSAPSTVAPLAALSLPAPPDVPSAPAPRAFGEAPAAPPAMVEQADDSATVFSAENRDVAPPTLRRQQLPLAVLTPGIDVPEGWSYLVLVVDPEGDVETVRLNVRTSAPGRSLYRHRMLVAAAKAWQFAPARKDGKPVRYAIRVALEP